ncbi:GDSL-like Lipase/Acylhydrolase superfamily protein [Euphorbia peplus]|nr:GDSL-like Lipase/Acylhydrolase superfamily protein [Euphorbia peplus]
MANCIVLLILSVLVVKASNAALPQCQFPAIYNFGDSNSDTGAISAAFNPIPPPNGETYFHKPAGRHSDGRLIIDFIAEKLNLPYLSSYLNSIGENFRHGANFATGGSTIRKPNSFKYGISPFSLDVQSVQFLQFKSRTVDLYHQVKNTPEAARLPRPQEFAKALYTFDIGQNDLSVASRTMQNDQFRAAALPDIINQLADAIRKICKEGGRSFWIHNTGPMGCLPQNLFYFKGSHDQYGCLKDQNKMAVEFNNKLKDKVIKLRIELPEAAITYVDIYAAKYGLITKAKSLGLADPLKACCGYHGHQDHIWLECGDKSMVNKTEVYVTPCKDTSVFISWDGIHYTEAANQWVANHTQHGSLVDPPVLITSACHRQEML